MCNDSQKKEGRKIENLNRHPGQLSKKINNKDRGKSSLLIYLAVEENALTMS